MAGYDDVISKRYASAEMKEIFSEQSIVRTWRKCWLSLAEAEHELGVKEITKQMLSELRNTIDNIDFVAAEEKERETQHDILAHIHAYGLACPTAKRIIHLGATSQCIKCNADLILQHKALQLVRKDLMILLKGFHSFIQQNKNLQTLSYTHFQPAQPTTLGRRFCVYAQDFLMDLHELDSILANYALRGAKGATGTQASYLTLLGDKRKVKKLDALFVKKLGFSRSYPITTQTYTRKFDIRIASLLASACASAKKLATDLRLLANLGIVDEPFGKGQAGSSAMPYKRNPMLCERICSLSRKVMHSVGDFYQTYAEQWLERSLDDSAIRRIDIPENFMLTDYILRKLTCVIEGLDVHAQQSVRLVARELPFLATEDILLACVKKGKGRQECHELIKMHAIEAARQMKDAGKENDLIERLSSDRRLGLSRKELERILSSHSFIGLSVEQAEDFLQQHLGKAISARKGR
ncbi:MAG: adenylosuccinate lyase [Nanoarchaeota archaeon]